MILNLEQLSHLIFARQSLTLNRCQFLAGMNNIIKKPLKITSFLQLNFAIAKIRVEIRLAEDGTGMGGI